MFESLQKLQIDPIFALMQQYERDENPQKVNVGIGIYRDIKGKPFVFDCIKKAIGCVRNNNFEYESMGGNQQFLAHTAKLFLGEDFDSEKLSLQQACGGTHACRLFADLYLRNNILGSVKNKPKILLSTPSWGNHFGIFKDFEVVKFSHLDENKAFNFSEYLAQVQAHPNSVLLLHGGRTHNPTGENFTLSQLEILAEKCNENQVFVFVDFSYLGLGKSILEDRKYLQILYKKCVQMAFGVSFSKNASLYKQRLGALFIKTNGVNEKEILESNQQNLIRESLSNLPIYPAEVMNIVFENFYEDWVSELGLVCADIALRRKRLLGPLPARFSYLKNGQGMFGLLGLSQAQVLELREVYSIYMMADSRINFAGVREQDFDYLVHNIKKVL